MAFKMDLQGYLIAYKVPTKEPVVNQKGQQQNHVWRTVNVDFRQSPKEEQELLRLGVERLLLTLNQKYPIAVAEILDGMPQKSEKYEVGEFF